MKKLFSLVVLTGLIYAQNLEMPPMIPTIGAQKQTSNSVKSVSKCDAIPPMLHILPPPLQEALDACYIEKFMPSQKSVEAYLKKEKIAFKTITVSPVAGFVRVYEINLGNNDKFYCNEKVTHCLKAK